MKDEPELVEHAGSRAGIHGPKGPFQEAHMPATDPSGNLCPPTDA